MRERGAELDLGPMAGEILGEDHDPLAPRVGRRSMSPSNSHRGRHHREIDLRSAVERVADTREPSVVVRLIRTGKLAVLSSELPASGSAVTSGARRSTAPPPAPPMPPVLLPAPPVLPLLLTL